MAQIRELSPIDIQPIINEGSVRGVGLMDIYKMPKLSMGSSQQKPSGNESGAEALITKLGVINDHDEKCLPATNPVTQTLSNNDCKTTGSTMATANMTYTGNNQDDIHTDDPVTYPE